MTELKKKANVAFFVGILACLIIASVIINVFIQKETDVPASPPQAVSIVIHEPAPKEPLESHQLPSESKTSGEVIRKTRVERGSDFLENIFYQGDKEIARQKAFGNDRYEQRGTIPDGPVKFTNEYDDTYGEEHYQNGKKHGTTIAYHKNGKLKSEEKYKEGKLN